MPSFSKIQKAQIQNFKIRNQLNCPQFDTLVNNTESFSHFTMR